MILSSPKEDHEVQTAQDMKDSSPFSSFFKVVDSIQGFNHLLDDISPERIKEAADQAKQLIERLAALQADLEIVKEIKYRLAKAKISSEETSYQTTRKTDSEAVKNASLLSPWPKNLIPFPRSAKLSKVQNIPTPFETSPLSPDTNDVEKEQNQTADLSAGSRNALQNPSLDNKIATLADNVLKETTSSPPEDRGLLETQSEKSHNHAIRPLTKQQSEDTCSMSLQPFTAIRKDTNGKTSDSELAAKTPKTKPDFDHRLLEDLIKDYGEISTHTRLGAEDEKSPGPTPLSGSETHQHSVEPRETNEPTYELTQTRFKTEGDLDRKLKTIIRDYGEVDIYSGRTSANIRKKTVIVTLILIMGYFASSFFFSVSQSENTATTLRLQSSVKTEVAEGPAPEQMVDPLQRGRRPFRTTIDQTLPETPLEQTPSRQPGE